MKVRELIALLEQYDENAEVRLATQPNYPLESAVCGVVLRDHYLDEDSTVASGKTADDVLILEGSQIGYGDRAAWGGR